MLANNGLQDTTAEPTFVEEGMNKANVLLLYVNNTIPGLSIIWGAWIKMSTYSPSSLSNVIFTAFFIGIPPTGPECAPYSLCSFFLIVLPKRISSSGTS